MVIGSSFASSDNLFGDRSSGVGGIDLVRGVGVEEFNQAVCRLVSLLHCAQRKECATNDSKDRSPSYEIQSADPAALNLIVATSRESSAFGIKEPSEI